MDDHMLARVAARTAAEVCDRYPAEEAARPLLSEDLTPREYVGLLLAGRHYPEAVRFLAHALPKREAVWWACRCVRLVLGADAPPAGCAAVAAFWGGGSLGPPNVPPIPPDDRLTAQAAAGAVMLAAVQTEPEKAPVKYRSFLAVGMEVARGADRWQEPKQ